MMRKMEKRTENRVTNYKYPGPVAKAAARVFFCQKQITMNFRPDNSAPETHTVIVPKKQIKEMRGERKT